MSFNESSFSSHPLLQLRGGGEGEDKDGGAFILRKKKILTTNKTFFSVIKLHETSGEGKTFFFFPDLFLMDSFNLLVGRMPKAEKQKKNNAFPPSIPARIA